MPTDPSQGENTYFIDAENVAEMARLMNQDRLMTKSMGGLFPERSDLSNIHNILDIACGPGGWVLDVARTYPEMQVMGIDLSQLMVEYARSQALTQGLKNASFRVMNALKPLNFPDNSFDLINARIIVGFMPTTAWPKLLQECSRILWPHGSIRLTEVEAPITNGVACEKLNAMVTRALKVAGQSFSPDGEHTGITPMLSRFLHNAGYENIQQRAHVVDYSAGMDAHLGFYQNFMVGYKLFQPFLVKMGVTTLQEVEGLYQQALEEMQSDNFCAILFLLTVSGERPAKKE
jgi:ubiquinone/menaquinone biosynthesis C-methylase UbiE